MWLNRSLFPVKLLPLRWHPSEFVYSQTSNKTHVWVRIQSKLKGRWNCWSFRCSWSNACRSCSNCIFIHASTPAFNGLGKDNFKARRETWNFGIRCDLYKMFDCMDHHYLVVLISHHVKIVKTKPYVHVKGECQINLQKTRHYSYHHIRLFVPTAWYLYSLHLSGELPKTHSVCLVFYQQLVIILSQLHV